MSAMKEKMSQAGTTMKEKMGEMKAGMGAKKEHGKAEMQETMDKAKHPMSKEAHNEADAKEHAHKDAANADYHGTTADMHHQAQATKEAEHMQKEQQKLSHNM